MYKKYLMRFFRNNEESVPFMVVSVAAGFISILLFLASGKNLSMILVSAFLMYVAVITFKTKVNIFLEDNYFIDAIASLNDAVEILKIDYSIKHDDQYISIQSNVNDDDFILFALNGQQGVDESVIACYWDRNVDFNLAGALLGQRQKTNFKNIMKNSISSKNEVPIIKTKDAVKFIKKIMEIK